MESGVLVGFFPDRSVAGGDASDSEMPWLIDPAAACDVAIYFGWYCASQCSDKRLRRSAHVDDSRGRPVRLRVAGSDCSTAKRLAIVPRMFCRLLRRLIAISDGAILGKTYGLAYLAEGSIFAEAPARNDERDAVFSRVERN